MRKVEGIVDFFGGAPAKPIFHAKNPSQDNWRADRRKVTIHDARSWAEAPSLDREGITLVPHKTKVANFADPAEVSAIYMREIEDIIRGLTGASKVVAISGGHMRYSHRTSQSEIDTIKQTSHFPHIDCTPKSAMGLVDNCIFGTPRAVLKPGQRLVGYNVWRVVSEPPQDVPLAGCDARTVARSDLIAADGIYDNGEKPWKIAEGYMLKYDPAQRWLYFSNMRPDEALVFRAYESNEAGLPGVPHAAFDDPTCPADAGGRVSVEGRVYAIFDE